MLLTPVIRRIRDWWQYSFGSEVGNMFLWRVEPCVSKGLRVLRGICRTSETVWKGGEWLGEKVC